MGEPKERYDWQGQLVLGWLLTNLIEPTWENASYWDDCVGMLWKSDFGETSTLVFQKKKKKKKKAISVQYRNKEYENIYRNYFQVFFLSRYRFLYCYVCNNYYSHVKVYKKHQELLEKLNDWQLYSDICSISPSQIFMIVFLSDGSSHRLQAQSTTLFFLNQTSLLNWLKYFQPWTAFLCGLFCNSLNVARGAVGSKSCSISQRPVLSSAPSRRTQCLAPQSEWRVFK